MARKAQLDNEAGVVYERIVPYIDNEAELSHCFSIQSYSKYKVQAQFETQLVSHENILKQAV
jgi:hypothetical protein